MIRRQILLGLVILVYFLTGCQKVSRKVSFPFYKTNEAEFIVGLVFNVTKEVNSFNSDSTLIYSRKRHINSNGLDSVVEYDIELSSLKHITNFLEKKGTYSKIKEFDLRFEEFELNAGEEEIWHDNWGNIIKVCVEHRGYCREFSYSVNDLVVTKSSLDNATFKLQTQPLG